MKFCFSLTIATLITASAAVPDYSINIATAQAQQLPSLPQSSLDGSPLKPGDRLRLTVIGFPEISGEQTVMADGGLQIPLAGYINVWGITPSQATELIATTLTPYIRRPQVSLAIEGLSPTRVSVTGAVVRSGPVVLDTPTASLHGASTLSEALSLAGGVTSNADLSNIIIRRHIYANRDLGVNGTFPKNSDFTNGITVDLWQSIRDGDLDVDIPVYDGDEIIVPISSQLTGSEQQILLSSSIAPDAIAVNVGGEVKRPGIVEISPNANVSSAVAAAGGLTLDGAAKNIILLRTSSDGTTESYIYDLGEESIVLNHGDSVIVSQSNRSQVAGLLEVVSRALNPFALLFRVFD